jgi:hypothetical protein
MAGEGRTGNTGGNASNASFDVLTQTQNSTNRRIGALEGEIRGRLRRRVLTVPVPGVPLVINREKTKLGELDTLQFELAPGTRHLRMVYRKTSEDASYNREEDWELTDSEMFAAHLERQLKEVLEFGTEYGIVGLVARADVANSVRVRNPDPFDDVTFLTTWETDPEFTNQPSRPDLGLILENNFNLLTKGFDAYLKVRVYAPINGEVTTFAGTASITEDSNIVTGSISFAGVIAVGQLIIVGTRTRKVTNVSGTQITVDVAYKETASGQAVNYGTPHTWLSAQTIRVGSKFKLTTDAEENINKSFVITSAEENQNHVDIRINGFLAARRYLWARNFYISALDGRNETPLSTVTFVAGNFTDATANIPELTSAGYDYDDLDPVNDNQREVIFKCTQPDPPVALAYAEFFLRIAGSGTITTAIGSPNLVGVGTLFTEEVAKGHYIRVGTQNLKVINVVDDTHLTTSPATDIATGAAYVISKLRGERGIRRERFHPEPGVTDREIRIHWGPVKTKKLANQDFVTRLTADNGFTREITDNFTTSADGDGAAQPLALAFPSAPSGSNNTVDGDPEKATARIALTLATGNGATFSANNNSQLEIVLIRRNAANTADIGNPFSEIKVLSTADLAATSCVHEFFLGMGRKFRITKVIARNGDKRAETTGTADFTAGGVLFVDPGDAKVVPAPVFGAITRTDTDDNKSDDITFTLAQDGTDIVLFKKLVFERNVNGSGWRGKQVFPLKAEDALHASALGSYSNTISVGRRAGKTVQYRLTAYAVGGKASATTTSGLQGATTGDVLTDTAVPTLATNPALGTTGPNVKERHSRIKANALMPSANINTLKTFQFVLSTQNTAPAGNPSIGSEGVVDIQYGQKVVFDISYEFPLTGDLYIYFRAQNQFATNSGYSVWSAGTNQHGYSRVIQDFIGSGVPTQAMGLIVSGTAPGAPPVANDATHYTISTGDPTDYQELIDAGYIIHLHIPSLAAADAVRLATAYDLATHRFAVAVAFGVTPGNSLNYEIHQGNRLGEKSGTLLSTTQINLGTAGALLADNTLLGHSIYMPSQPAADQIRKITAHSGGVITLDTAVAAALASNACYLICSGSFGYAAINPLSGIIAAVPMRVWYNSETGENVLEVIMPTGENALSINAVHIPMYRKSNGVLRDEIYEGVTVTATYKMIPPGTFVPVFRMQLQNAFREGGSDGYSAYTYYVEGYQSGAAPAVTYAPATYVPVSVDIYAEDNYPKSRYPDYF